MNTYELKANNIGGMDTCGNCHKPTDAQLGAEVFIKGTTRPACRECAPAEMLAMRDKINAFEFEGEPLFGEMTDDQRERAWWENIESKVYAYNDELDYKNGWVI